MQNSITVKLSWNKGEEIELSWQSDIKETAYGIGLAYGALLVKVKAEIDNEVKIMGRHKKQFEEGVRQGIADPPRIVEVKDNRFGEA